MIKHSLLMTSAIIILAGCISLPTPNKDGGATSAPIVSPEHIEKVRSLNSADLTKLADKGDQYAQYYLGNTYAQDASNPQNLALAKNYWQKAGNQGNASALFNLGMLAFTGQGEPKSYETALSYFKQSANAGNTRAALNAASMLEAGQGTYVSIPEAAQLYQLALPEQPHAAYRLGLLYVQDTPDFPADYQQAMQLFQQAASSGDRFAPRALSIIQNYPPEEAKDLLRRLNNGV
ncbi:tetratricopeptide repeat protein [Ignatzschineria sp. LJL83]